MTWAKLMSRGSGSLRFAAVIEGWPEIWVTDSSITLTNATSGRAVRVGLLYRGLEIQERALIAEGRLEASGMTFSFRSADNRDHACASFARVGQVVGRLSANLLEGATSIALAGGVTLANGTHYHIGTEAFLANATLTRGVWESQAQAFNVADGDDLLAHEVHAHPTTVEGRRITIYAWGEGDDVTRFSPTGSDVGQGKPIWRGVVSRPPLLESDCMTWRVQADHVYSVFKQSQGAKQTEIKPVGIYHSNDNPIFIPDLISSGPGPLQPYFASAFSQTIDLLVASVNAHLSTALAARHAVPALTQITTIYVTYDSATNFFFLNIDVGTTFNLDSLWYIGSHFMGYAAAGNRHYPWLDRNGAVANNLTALGVTQGNTFVLNAGNTYHCILVKEAGFPDFFEALQSSTGPKIIPEVPSGACSGLLGPYTSGPNFTADSEKKLNNFPERIRNRLYIDRDWSGIGSNAVSITYSSLIPPPDIEMPTDGGVQITVIANGLDATAGVNAYWIEFDDSLARLNYEWFGWVVDSTEIRPVYRSAVGVDVVGFVAELIARAVAYSNDGNVPFIRATDFDTAITVSSPIPDITSERIFTFVKEIKLEDVLAEELKLIAHMWSTNAQGKLRFVASPLITENAATVMDIGPEHILTPEGRQGAWPSYTIQSQGLVTTVTIKQTYDALEDEHTGPEHIMRNATLLSTHKRRGVTEVVIAPKSNPSSHAEIDQAMAIQVASLLMGILGREYATISIKVNWKCFPLYLGDIVGLTISQVPNSDGTRGLAGKRAIVIGRRWPLDPADDGGGTLELLTLLKPPKGYTPSGVVTAQALVSGNTWNITLGTANALNELISPLKDGDVARTFAVGDNVRVLQANASIPSSVTGTVSSIAGAVVTVALTGLWTPGALTWTLEYQPHGAATSTQRAHAFVAGSSTMLSDGSPGAVFA